jgi:uncharacterized protein YkwD
MPSNPQHLLVRPLAKAALAALATGLLVLIALLPAPSAAAGGGCKGANGSPGTLTAGELRRATFCLINRQRQRHGLGRLHSDRKLRKAATRHSSDMVRRDFFSHFSPGGGSIQGRIGGSGYLAGARRFAYGEVIGGGTGDGASPKAVVRAWMNSSAHRSAILHGGFRDMGAGVVHGFPGRGSEGATFTVDFGSRSG